MSDISIGSGPGSGGGATGEPVRLGLIGCGRHARQVLLPAIQRCKGLRLVGIATAHEATAAEVTARFGYPTVVGHEGVLYRRDIEAVVIATPAVLQTELTVAALWAGKHVFCETPGPRTPEDVAAVRRAQSAAGRVVGYGTCLRYAPIYRHLRDLIPDVRAGGPVVLTVRYYAGLRHVVDLADFLLGEVARVIARAVGEQRVVTLEFASGDLGVIHSGGPVHYGVPLEAVEISGAAGVLAARGSRELVAFRLPDPAGVDDLEFASAPAMVWEPSSSLVYGALNPLTLRGYVPELEAFARAIRDGAELESGLAAAERAAKVERAIATGLAAGGTVAVEASPGSP